MMLNKYPKMIMRIGCHFEDLLLTMHKCEDENEEDFVLKHKHMFDNAFIYASATQHPVLNFLLSYGLTKNYRDMNGDTLLHIASAYQRNEYVDVHCMRCLLDIRYDANLRNAMGKLPYTSLLKRAC